MRNRNTNSLIALLSAVLLLSAVAQAAGQPWPEAHSGAYLGVQVKEVTSENASALKLTAPTGAVIAYVDQDGPACHAGLMENDVVIAFDGAKVDGPQQLQNMIHVAAPQKTVVLTIVRNGQHKDVKVVLGSWNVMSHARAFNAANNAFSAASAARLSSGCRDSFVHAAVRAPWAGGGEPESAACRLLWRLARARRAGAFGRRWQSSCCRRSEGGRRHPEGEQRGRARHVRLAARNACARRQAVGR